MENFTTSTLAKDIVITTSNSNQAEVMLNQIYLLFHKGAEEKQLSVLDQVFTKNLIVEKNNDILDYDTFRQYAVKFTSDPSQVAVLPFHFVLVCDSHVAARYTLSKTYQGFTKQEKFISIFKFNDNKIETINEICIAI